MAAVYSTRFIGAVVTGAGGTLSYVVPAGKVAVVRHISMLGLAVAGMSGAYVYAVVAGEGNIVMANVVSPWARGGFAYQFEDLRVVVNAGEQIEVLSGDPIGWHFLVSGFLLSTP